MEGDDNGGKRIWRDQACFNHEAKIRKSINDWVAVKMKLSKCLLIYLEWCDDDLFPTMIVQL